MPLFGLLTYAPVNAPHPPPAHLPALLLQAAPAADAQFCVFLAVVAWCADAADG